MEATSTPSRVRPRGGSFYREEEVRKESRRGAGMTSENVACSGHETNAPWSKGGTTLATRRRRARSRLTGLGWLGLLSLLDHWIPAFRWFALFYFAFLIKAVELGMQVVTGIVRLLRWNRDRPRTLPRITLRRVLTYYASSLLVLLNPWILVQALLMTAGQVLAGSRMARWAASPERSAVAGYTPPFTGTWTVARGGLTPETSHSWDVPNQRYAYDFIITDDRGRSCRGDGKRLEDYYCFGREVLAPKDGEVVSIRDGERDFPHPGTGMLDPLARDARGNYVLIRHGPREYSLLAHLQRGSLRVRAGDLVRRGQVIGRCGNSGHSTEPHLHFHVQDHESFFLGAGLPVMFADGRFFNTGDRVCGPSPQT